MLAIKTCNIEANKTLSFEHGATGQNWFFLSDIHWLNDIEPLIALCSFSLCMCNMFCFLWPSWMKFLRYAYIYISYRWDLAAISLATSIRGHDGTKNEHLLPWTSHKSSKSRAHNKPIPNKYPLCQPLQPSQPSTLLFATFLANKHYLQKPPAINLLSYHLSMHINSFRLFSNSWQILAQPPEYYLN